VCNLLFTSTLSSFSMKTFIHFRTHYRSKSIVWILVFGIGTTSFSCQSDPRNRPSPLTVDSASIGNVGVKVTYSSPGVKGREIFGNGADFLVPYGEVWRTGANDASFITLKNSLIVDSTLFDSGSYSLFTIPDKKNWIVIFNRKWDQWGAYNYQDSLDILRLSVPSYSLQETQERMQLFIKEDSLKFRWDKTGWAVKLSNLP